MKDQSSSEPLEEKDNPNCARVDVSDLHIYIDHYHEKPEEYVCNVYQNKNNTNNFSGTFQQVMSAIIKIAVESELKALREERDQFVRWALEQRRFIDIVEFNKLTIQDLFEQFKAYTLNTENLT